MSVNEHLTRRDGVEVDWVKAVDGTDTPPRPYTGTSDKDVCTPEHIPYIMRAKGWRNGARLLDRWFEGDASTDKAAVSPEYVKISWVLSFERARLALEKVLAAKVWTSAAAQQVIAGRLAEWGCLRSWRVHFGDFQKSGPALHADHVQYAFYTDYRDFSQPSTWDDLLAALGNFAFYFVVGGSVEPENRHNLGSYRVTITRIGVYIRDDFDFEGDQFLGIWALPDYAGVDACPAPLPPVLGCYTTNETFRQWRDEFKKGGDYHVYSDLKIIRTNDSFVIRP